LAIDVSGIAREQERHHFGNVLSSAEAAQWIFRSELSQRGFANGERCCFGEDHAWGNDVAANVLSAEGRRHVAHELFNGGL
jgi:hypothetical protein